MIRLEPRRMVLKSCDTAKHQGEVHVLNTSVRRDVGKAVETCVELLQRGVAIVEVAKLSGLPENTLSHLVRAREIPIRRAGRGPRNLDLVVRDPLSHLQISVFLVSLQLQRQLCGAETLDAETYLAAMRRTERAGVQIAPELLPYLALSVQMWLETDLELQQCHTCAGVHCKVKMGTGYSIRQSSRCPFCMMVDRIRQGNLATSIESVDLRAEESGVEEPMQWAPTTVPAPSTSRSSHSREFVVAE